MRIGIYLDNWGGQAGGGHSYTKTVVDYFSRISSNHEFIFIVKTSTDDLPGDYHLVSKFVLYNPFEKNNGKNEGDNEKYIRSLERLLKASNFFIEKLKLTSVTMVRDKLKGKIENSRIPQKDPLTFRKLIQENQIKCVYYPAAFTCEDFDIPFYSTIWDLGHLTISVFPEVSNNGQYDARQNLLNAIVHRAYRIISESESGKSDICHYYNTNPDKIVIVPQFPSGLVPMIIPNKEVNDILEKFNLKNEKYLFYPAQFWPHKNHINLIRAMSALKQEGIVIQLIFTGSDQGNLNYVMDFLKDANLQDQIRYLGFVSDAEMKVLYSYAFAMVFPSLLGPTNMPISEAISCGCPVICSDFSGHREQTQGAALYIDPKDYLDIKEKIKILVKDEGLRDSMIKNGLEVSKNNSVDHVFKGLLASFDEFEKIRLCWKN
jgi:glycosyltransferase involved in cell wall biosynthesis